ncbi:MAG: GtrA family protein [Desulfobulbaceae bacterium]|nr:MAG: GtrA family protein [Desulfobulbaceae bacterium]
MISLAGGISQSHFFSGRWPWIPVQKEALLQLQKIFNSPRQTRGKNMPTEYAALIQFIKYAIAGGIATIAHITIFHCVAWKIFPSLGPNDHAVRFFRLKIREVNDYSRARNSMIGNIIAFCFSNMVAYIMNILWVFERGRHTLAVEILLFYLVSGISTMIGTILMGVLIKRFGLLTTYAFVANIVSAVLINYALRKYFIFLG